MVFYFSGTGNSEYVATTLANFLGLQKDFIPDIEPEKVTFMEERTILVFPVYSWGVPPLVIKFIEKLSEAFIENFKASGLDFDCVMVCGDEVALAPEMLKKACLKRGLLLNSIWSVIMPNNYVILPGFDVDTKEIKERKLKECQGRILEIAEGIQRGDKRIDVVRGSFPWVKTKIVYPLFKKWGIFPKKWHYSSSCISCGKCSMVCPLCNVEMQEGHPRWGTRCCSCLACYHICPVHAVEYGKETMKKGQYFFPLKKISSIGCHKK